MTSAFGKGRAVVVAAIIALFAVPVGVAGPAAAVPPPPVAKYVALGDSYAAGQGTGVYLNACLQSPLGYPGQLDAEPRVNLLRNAACTGADFDDVDAQLSQLNRGTTLVTVTVGANGVDLSGLYAACASGQTPVECAAALNDAAMYLNSGEVVLQLSELISAIAERSPRATIVVTGYPLPFAAGLSPLTDNVNQLVELLNTQLALAALSASVVWAPVDFGTHRIGGSGEPWLGQDPTNPETFLHPTVEGYQAYAAVINAVR